MGLLMLYAFSRPFSKERLRAWLDGKPEPKDGPAKAPTSPVVTATT
jgi:hypothetical protein